MSTLQCLATPPLRLLSHKLAQLLRKAQRRKGRPILQPIVPLLLRPAILILATSLALHLRLAVPARLAQVPLAQILLALAPRVQPTVKTLCLSLNPFTVG